MKVYTGIGSRKTPEHVQDDMTFLAGMLWKDGWILRGGHAEGADRAFERGVHDRRFKEIYRAGDVEVSDKAWTMVKMVHPFPSKARKFRDVLGRNPYQLLGKNLDEPSIFVVCWTPGGQEIGGTLVNIRLARAFNIPVFNLHDCTVDDVLDFVARRGS